MIIAIVLISYNNKYDCECNKVFAYSLVFLVYAILYSIFLYFYFLPFQKSCSNLDVFAKQYTGITEYLVQILKLFKKRLVQCFTH